MSKALVKQARLKPSLEQVIEVCKNYNIGDLISIKEEIENTVNVNIKILTTTGEYVIRIFTADAERLSTIISILTILDKNGIPVLLPLKDIEGQYFSCIDTKALQVTSFVHGRQFSNNEAQAKSSGRMLRRFHDALTGTHDPVKPKASLYPTVNVIKASLTHIERMKNRIPKEQAKLVANLYDEIIKRWDLKCPQIPQTIIHGDWHQGNQLYSDADDVCCIMDFDFMTRAERIFDIAYALWRFRVYKENMNIAKAFMDGYGALSDQEIDLLPLEIARINYFFICSSALSLNPEFELNNQIKHEYPFLKWALSTEGENVLKSLCQK